MSSSGSRPGCAGSEFVATYIFAKDLTEREKIIDLLGPAVPNSASGAAGWPGLRSGGSRHGVRGRSLLSSLSITGSS
jgi:hypothetical protein